MQLVIPLRRAGTGGNLVWFLDLLNRSDFLMYVKIYRALIWLVMISVASILRICIYPFSDFSE